MLRKFIKNGPIHTIFFKEPIKPLGRWGLGNNKKIEIKGTLANIDCCGDDRCGDVNTIQQAINSIEKKIPNFL